MQDTKRVVLNNSQISDNAIHVIRCSNNENKLHLHNFYEFGIVIKGGGVHTLNNVEYPNKRGDMYFLRLTDFHKIKPDSHTQIKIIQVPVSCMPEDILKLLCTCYGNLYGHADDVHINRVATLCRLLEKVCEEEPKYDEEYAKLLFGVIVRTFFKIINSNCIHASGNSRLLEICIFIQEHFSEEIDISTIATYFNLNKNYLCTFFKKNTGTTLSGFIRDLRLQYAARLANATDYSSLQICELSGYGSHSNFLRDFKKRFGMSPLQMRKNN